MQFRHFIDCGIWVIPQRLVYGECTAHNNFGRLREDDLFMLFKINIRLFYAERRVLTTLLKSDDAFAEQPLYFGNQEGSENFAKSNYLLWYYALRLSANVENESLDKHPFAY